MILSATVRENTIKKLFIGLCLVGGPISPTQAVELALKPSKTQLVETQDKSYWYDTAVGRKEAGEIVRSFLKKDKDPSPEIYSIPGLKRYYLVNAYESAPTTNDCGRHFFLVKKTKEGIATLDRTHGCGDEVEMVPHFYSKGGKVLLLAEMEGEDGSWGYEIYRIWDEKLLDMGPLCVYSEDAASEGPDAPVPLKVLAVGEGWRVEFRDNLMLELPDRAQKLTKFRHLKRHGDSPIGFYFDGKRFVLDEKSCDVASEYEQKWKSP